MKNILTIILVFIFVFFSTPVFAAIVTERVSVASDGTEADDQSKSSFSNISSDNRYITFTAEATNLVLGDTNEKDDIFVHDRTTGTTERVSVASDGTQADNSSSYPSISSDGRYVAFLSSATNLVLGDTNEKDDIFVHDRTTGTTERVSVASDGTQADNSSSYPSISSDGRYVAFLSSATNLVSGDTNVKADIFVHDRTTGTTERVSVASDGTQENNSSSYLSISSDGRYVAFRSDATNLVSGDTNVKADIFVHDRTTGTTERVSVASDGTQENNSSSYPSISSDGRYVAFYSTATNLVSGDTNVKADIFVHDRTTGTTERVSVASDGTQENDSSTYPSISSDGRYVAFYSNSTNLVSGDTNAREDIFVHDRITDTTERVSVASDGTQADDSSLFPSISSDGRYVAFISYSEILVSGDTNWSADMFLTTGYLASSFVTAGITQSFLSSSITEGSEATYTVVLDSEPIDDVVITLASDVADVTVSPTTLTFTSANYDTPQTVTITSTDDTTDETDFDATISHTVASDDTDYDGFSMDDYVLSVADNDEPQEGTVTGSRVNSLRNPTISQTPSQDTTSTISNIITQAQQLLQSPLITEEIKNQIQNLIDQANKLLNNTPSNEVFTKNLELNMIDEQVRLLQKFLNTHGFQISTQGPGSLGNETNIFGTQTQSTLIKFQKANNITPAVGFFGPITRGVVNGMFKN